MSERRLFALAALAFTALAFVTRAGQSLDYDELFTVWVSSRPANDLVHQANLDGFTPPAFYALVKLLSLAGVVLEDLRVLPVLFGGLAVYLGLTASLRIFGPVAQWPALLLIPGSAYLFTFSHELRPYSALLACAFLFHGQLGGSASPRSDRWAAGAALFATALSYLGAVLVLLWLFECRERCSRSRRLAVGLAAILICAPGLQKAFTIAAKSIDSTLVWSARPPFLSTLFFGLAPTNFDPPIEAVGLILLAGLVAAVHLAGWATPLKFLARAVVVSTVAVFALDLLIPLGFAPRYFVLAVSALLLFLVGALARFGRPGLWAALALFALNGLAVFRYLTVRPAAREDWREAMGRFEGRLGSGGALLAFPFHHAAVAGHAYAPRLTIGGGYTSKAGPLYWYEPPARFAGYSFSDLTRVEDPRTVLKPLAAVTDLCLVTDEPDASKTARLFTAFEALGDTERFDTGDPRLRARCRTRD